MTIERLVVDSLAIKADQSTPLPDKENHFGQYMMAIHRLVPEKLTHAPLQERKIINVDGVDVRFWTKNLHQTSIKSFKGVGAFLAMWKAKRQGQTEVVAASAGNHAQGVAISAKALEMNAIIYMPVGTSKAKIEATERFGKPWVDIRLEGEQFGDSKAIAEAYVQNSETAVSIAPYDDQDVIDGQGLHLYEVFRAMENSYEVAGKVDAVLMGIGGGGLFAGSMQVRNQVSPDTVMIGVEQAGAHCAKAALESGDRSALPGNAYAAGTNVSVLGERNFEVISDLKKSDDMFVTVNNGEIARATNAFTKVGEKVETAGALGTAALLCSQEVRRVVTQLVQQAKADGRTEVNIINFVTGGNLTPEEQVQRKHEAEIYTGNRQYIELEIPENTPGALKNLAQIIRDQGVNIVEFKFSSHDQVSVDGGQVVKFGLLHDNRSKLENLMSALSGYRVNEVSHKEAEKIADCLPKSVTNFTKRLATKTIGYHKFSLQIKQKPGSLLEMIERVPAGLNIEFFDYIERSPEADFGRVKIGFSGSAEDISKASAILQSHYEQESEPELIQAI